MNEFKQFLTWCDTMYENSSRGACGEVCTNELFCNGTQPDCYACIRRVHNIKNRTIHYNCENMLYCYVLKQGYRFIMEMYLLFKARYRDIALYDDLWVTSIGCGPCTELYGGLAVWRGLSKDDDRFHFRGFDLEERWASILNKVPVFLPTVDVITIIGDCFEYYKASNEQINIIVLNYMLSDMVKFHGGQLRSFFFKLCALILEKNPRYLMINDIYLRDSIAASNALIEYIKSSGFNIQYGRRQFHILDERIGKFGKLEGPKPFTISNVDVSLKYDPFSAANSIQTIIEIL